jgi:hypothetical protein
MDDKKNLPVNVTHDAQQQSGGTKSHHRGDSEDDVNHYFVLNCLT